MALVSCVSFGSYSGAWSKLLLDMRLFDTCPYSAGGLVDILVFPAASSPSISRRISLLPKILARERESAAPIVSEVCCGVGGYGFSGPLG
jgi:hypothetical protein